MPERGEWIIGSDGALEHYVQPYQVSEEQLQRADELLEIVQEQKKNVEVSFLRLGQALDTIDREELYKAHGVPSFRAWVMSPNVDLSYRVAADLLRIVREVLPILPADVDIPTISTLRELLPILGDADGGEKFIEAVYEVEGLNIKDTRERVKELRGQSRPVDESSPAIFSARVRMGDVNHRVDISCSTGVDYYNVGTLTIRREHWSRFESRFGAFIQFEEVS